MSLSRSLTAESFFLFSLSVFLSKLWVQSRPKLASETTDVVIHDDAFYLQQAQRLRLQLDPPRQSHFRVVALLLLENGTIVAGANDEASPSIAGAICAERAALLRYRSQLETLPIQAIYIVTDADRVVPPGTACREYLHGHPATGDETRIVLQSQHEHSRPWILTLPELHPYPSIYARMTVEEQVAFGSKHEELIERELEHVKIKGLFEDQVYRLLESAHQAALEDDLDVLHAVRYGAAVAVEREAKVDILTAHQIKALEYSSTLDAVCQLASKLERGDTVLAWVMVDQFGIPHAPFCAARSFLTEQGYGQSLVILTTQALKVVVVEARELAPYTPIFR